MAVTLSQLLDPISLDSRSGGQASEAHLHGRTLPRELVLSRCSTNSSNLVYGPCLPMGRLRLRGVTFHLLADAAAGSGKRGVREPGLPAWCFLLPHPNSRLLV